MPTMKINLSGVDTEASGFEIYDGPVPKPGVYNAVVKVARIKVGKTSKNPYFSLLVELGADKDPEKNKCKGAAIWANVVPGEAEIQQIRTAQLMRALTGKQDVNIVHNDVDADDKPGEITKIGGKNPVGIKLRVQVKREIYNDEPRAAIDAFLPAKDEEDLEELEELEEIEVDEDLEEDVDEDEVDEDAEEEDEDVEEDEDEEAEGDEPTDYETAAAMTLVALRKHGEEWGYDAADLKEYKKKDELLEFLIEEGCVAPAEEDVEDEESDEDPF